MSDPVQKSGLLASLRQLLSTVLEMAQVRLALLGTELELEKQRLFDALLWAALGLLLFALALLALGGLVVIGLWDSYRLSGLAVVALFFFAAGALVLRHARQSVHNAHGLFAASLAELERDHSALKAPTRHDAQ